jgi:hypothetical protein
MKVRNENNEFKEIIMKGLGFSFQLGGLKHYTSPFKRLDGNKRFRVWV